jgi:hypothetical protein
VAQPTETQQPQWLKHAETGSPFVRDRTAGAAFPGHRGAVRHLGPRAGRLRPARAHPRRPTRPSHGPGRQRLHRQLPRRADVMLTAADGNRCRELSLRIREDLIHLGHVDGTRTVQIAESAKASVGDLVICAPTTTGSKPGNQAEPWRTGTCCGSRPSPHRHLGAPPTGSGRGLMHKSRVTPNLCSPVERLR